MVALTRRCLLITALALSLIATIIKIVSLSAPHFVDVHLIENSEDKADENRIASIGVFQSQFDATSPDVAEGTIQAGVPPIKLESATTEFPLLFPSQENFFPEILPVNSRNIGDLLGLFQENEALIVETAILGGEAAVAGVEFEECDSFVTEITLASAFYFVQFQDVLVPNTIAVIQNSFKNETENSIFPLLEALLEPNNVVSFPFHLAGTLPQLVFTSDFVADNAQNAGDFGCEEGFPELDPNVTILAEDLVCLINVYEAIGNEAREAVSVFDFAETFSRVLAANGNICVLGELSIPECIVANQNSFIVLDTGILDVAQFGGAVNVCNGVVDSTTRLCGDGSKASFLLGVAQVLQQLLPVLDPLVVQAAGAQALFLSAYLQVLQVPGLFLSPGATFVDRFDLWDFLEASDVLIDGNQTFSQDFSAACDSLLAFTTIQEALLLQDFGEVNCATVGTYFPAVSGTLLTIENEFALTVAGVARIYAACFDSQILDPESQNGDCPGVFAVGLLQGLLGSSQELVEECEDDVEDNEKIVTAQGLAIASTFFEALTLVLIVLLLVVQEINFVLLASVASFFSILGAIQMIAALLVVESAPVYEEVGGAPDGEFEAIFFTGYVGPLGLVAAALYILCGILLGIACCLSPTVADEDFQEDEKELKVVAQGGKNIEDQL